MNSMLADATHPKQKVYHSYQKIKTHEMTKKIKYSLELLPPPTPVKKIFQK